MIDPTTHRTMSERSTSELRPAPQQVENVSSVIIHQAIKYPEYLGYIS